MGEKGEGQDRAGTGDNKTVEKPKTRTCPTCGEQRPDNNENCPNCGMS
jgi:ribosomal protein S27AE